MDNLSRYGFNDRASSADVATGRWEVCEDSRFHGRCVILRQGRYPPLAAMGLNDRVSSVRLVSRDVPSQARPEFWDVTYTFRGLGHQVQLSAHPGRSVTVNRHGEPRE